MNTVELAQALAELAERHQREGTTSDELMRVADEQRRTGFSITAEYTQCIARYLATLEARAIAKAASDKFESDLSAIKEAMR